MVTLQDLIHHLEVGAGMQSFNRTLRWIGCIAGAVLLLVAYDLRVYRNFSNQEAMDTAQLAHNLSDGRGYSTLFIRPLSVFLVQQHRQGVNTPNQGPQANPGKLKGDHPDLANAPVYPVFLAGLMKALPFHYAIPQRPQRFWSFQGKFYRYQPEFIIALANQVLFLVLVFAVYYLTKRLFDVQVAWVTAVLLFGTELLWRFTTSGLSTILLMLIFVALIWSVVALEEEARQPKGIRGGLFGLAALLGAFVGVGALTRYSFGWLILPVVLFILIYTTRRRVLLACTSLLTFVVFLTPWVARNYSLSGMPFGTATYAIIENSQYAPEDSLERSLSPQILRPLHNPFPFLTVAERVFSQKLVTNLRAIVQSDLPRLGGTWVSGFFLVGLLVRFRNPALGRLRVFLISSMVFLAVVQALGRTKLSDDSPDVNSENLLILFAPMVLAYGVSLFFILLDQVELPLLQFRGYVIWLFGIVVCMPLMLAVLPPKNVPIVYPPYYPPAIQRAVGYTREDEMMMSDIPWAVAWYGQSQCISLTPNARADFFAINDLYKPVSALYLTPQTVERWTQVGDWGNLFLQTVRVLPSDGSKYPLKLGLTLPGLDGPSIPFPLDYLQAGWPMQLLFTFRPHWPDSH